MHSRAVAFPLVAVSIALLSCGSDHETDAEPPDESRSWQDWSPPTWRIEPDSKAGAELYLHVDFGYSSNGADPLRRVGIESSVDEEGRTVRVTVTYARWSKDDPGMEGSSDFVQVVRRSRLGPLPAGDYEVEWHVTEQILNHLDGSVVELAPPSVLAAKTTFTVQP